MKVSNFGFGKITMLAAGLSVLALGVTPASASVVYVYEGTSPGTVAGSTNFIYDLNFVTTTDTVSGTATDRFVGDGSTFGTLYDVPGFLGATLSSVTAPFTVSTQLVGRTPIGIAPTDSTTITNITLTYTGTTISSTSGMSFPLVLTVTSSFSGTSLLGQYSGEDIKNAGGASGTFATNFGFVTVPASSVPEPASIYAFAGGLGLLLVGRLGRRRRS